MPTILKLMMWRMKKNEEEEDDGMLCNKPESPTQMERVFTNPAFPVPKRIFSVNIVNFNAEQGD
jgi:hypothetical protein